MSKRVNGKRGNRAKRRSNKAHPCKVRGRSRDAVRR